MNSLTTNSTISSPIASNVGKVILAGAGCGDPELITVKAARYLQQADIVLTDRLVSDEILKTYVSAHAEIIYVGKQCRRGFSTPQESINDLLVQYAQQGKLVVRLKGGDASLFSNILDELIALSAHQIPYEIVPGITAATGAAAYAGIPLTARGHSTAVRFLTLYKSDVMSAHYWKELAATDDTLVFYMSAETLGEVVNQLRSYQISTEKKLAIVEQATTPFQNVVVSDIYDYDISLSERRFISPTLVIIGKVVNLHQQFAWLPNSESREYYFKPVGSMLPANHTTNKELKNVSRA